MEWATVLFVWTPVATKWVPSARLSGRLSVILGRHRPVCNDSSSSVTQTLRIKLRLSTLAT
jgi:hypothetical protein